MASSSSSPSSSSNPINNNNIMSSSSPSTFDPNLPTNTTFVHADPTSFRTIVQKLTGADHPTHHHKLAVEMGPRRPPFKLHERRQSARKLEILLNHNHNSPAGSRLGGDFIAAAGEKVMVSPVSPLDMFTRGSSSSPRTPHSPIDEEEEEKAIAEKGFYLHRSPLSTPRGGGGGAEPELLPLFPLHSPRD